VSPRRATLDKGRQEIWPLIMEKAYAKLHGGYHQINKGGDPAQAMPSSPGMIAPMSIRSRLPRARCSRI
jgi:hypothetical protein